jgi:hypothetical protein
LAGKHGLAGGVEGKAVIDPNGQGGGKEGDGRNGEEWNEEQEHGFPPDDRKS